MRWTIANGSCVLYDDVVVKFNQNPTAATAGADQTGTATCGLTSVTLAGNAASIGTGAWSIISGAGGTITTSSSATSSFSGAAGTTYTLRWTISSNPCTATSDDVVIAFNQNPTIANAGANQNVVSSGGIISATLAANAPTVGTGLWSIVSGTGGTITDPTNPTSTFTGSASSAFTLRWTITSALCTSSDDMLLTSGYVWTGLAGDDLWTTGGNWSTGLIPSPTTDIVINYGTPKLNVDYSVGGTLILSDNGTLTINPGKTLSIASTGVVDFGGKSVIIKSTAAGTGQLGQILGTLSNATNVTVERYIPATGRRYRILTPSVNTTGSIKANWMEGNMNTPTSGNRNAVIGYGTQITGPGGNANGFDASGTNSASLYLTSNGVNLTYTSVSNTNGTLSALTGYFLFIRGDRSMNMNLFNTNVPPNPIPLVSSATTLRATGTVVQGTVTSFANPLSSAAGGLSLIANPYPAAIDWDSVYAASSNINNYYTYWDPNLGFRGGFVTVRTDGIKSNDSSLASPIMQSGQAFFVTTTANGLPSIIIRESHKVGDSANNVHGIFKSNMIVDDIVSTKVKGISPLLENNQPALLPKVSKIPAYRISLYYTESSGYKRLTDGAVALFDNQYSAALDGNDAVEVANWDENIAIMRNGQNLAIESRADLNENDTLAISMSTMKAMNYALQFQGSNFGSSLLQPLLIDNYLKTLTPLSLTLPTTIPFTVTSDTATSSKNRFKVVFKTSVVLPFTVTKITATKKNETVQVDWEVKTDEELKSFDIERSFDGRNFVKLATVASLGKGIVLANYSWIDNNPLNGENYYRIKVNPVSGDAQLSSVAVVEMDMNKPSMVVFPNPTEGNDFNIKLSNIVKGSYQIIVTNANGQQVLVKTIEHKGGTITHLMEFDKDISKGLYRVQVQGEGLSLLSSIIKN